MQFENLTEEQIAKAKACTSPEEILALAREEGYELSDEMLEEISGGSFWDELGKSHGDVRDDVTEAQVSEAFMAGELHGDELD